MKRIKEWWHWLTDRKSWRTVYTDGQRAMRSTYRVSLDYAEMFGGTVEFDPRKDN